MEIILASQSPRRKELMGKLNIPFVIRVADVDETMDPQLPPEEEVARVSGLKAAAVPHEPGDIVIAADTIVVCDGKVLGKPKDDAEGVAMLQMLSGRAHQVMTGMTLLKGDRRITHTEITDVHFRPLSQRDIADYISSGEHKDKAGAYGIQGGAAVFVDRISGDYFNVVGLPVCRLQMLLRQIMEERQ